MANKQPAAIVRDKPLFVGELDLLPAELYGLLQPPLRSKGIGTVSS